MSHFCFYCIEDPGARGLFREQSTNDECSICGNVSTGVSLEALGGSLGAILQDFYVLGGYDVFADDYPGDDLMFVVAECLQIDDSGDTEEICQYLIDNGPAWPGDGDEPFFSLENTYVFRSPSTGRIHRRWIDFAESVKTTGRFFGPHSEMMETIFSLPPIFPTSEQPGFFDDFDAMQEMPVLTFEVGDDAVIYRGRIAKSPSEVELLSTAPQNELSYNASSPPSGRMNSEGISTFYGAFSLDTALKELRPPVGGTIVMGKFRPLRSLRLLDLSRLGRLSWNSIFSPSYRERHEKLSFMQDFDSIVSQPVQPGQERIAYLPTQIVAEYVHQRLGFDGLVYSSAQEEDQSGIEKKNVAIFGCQRWRAILPDTTGEPSQPSTDQAFSGESLFTICPEDLSLHTIRGIEYATNMTVVPAPANRSEPPHGDEEEWWDYMASST